MEIYALGVYVPGDTVHTTIQSAIDAAHAAPGGAVWIPAYYTGSDSYTNANRVPIIDMRSSGTLTAGTISGATVALAQAAAAAQVTGLTGGIFLTTLNAPGVSVLEGRTFNVRAGGYTTFAAGTYTAVMTVNLYGFGSAAFTPGGSNAIFSASALSVTNASTAVVKVGWQIEAELEADSVIGILQGRGTAMTGTAAAGVAAPVLTAATAIGQAPTGLTLSAATPVMQFAAGVTIDGHGASANLLNFNLSA